LKGIFDNHVHSNQWDVIADLEYLNMNGLSSKYDQASFYSTLGRSASLRYRYAKAKEAFEIADTILKGLSKSSKKFPALEAYFDHSYGIYLGYTGRSGSCKEYVTRARVLYEQLNAEHDLIHLSLNEIDVSMYSPLKGYTNLENRLKALRERLKKTDFSGKGYDLRFGVLNYLIYLKTGNRKRLEKSNFFFSESINKAESNNYRAYWAQCGSIVTAKLLGRENTGLLGQAPPGGIAYANRFPPIILLLVECDRILGNRRRVWERLRRFDAHVTLMLAQFSQDEHYKKFILENFALVVEKRIQVVLKEKSWTSEQKMNRIIRANEIQQNRLLQLKTELKTGSDFVTNITELIKKMARSKKKTGLIYVTGEFTENGKRKTVLMIRPDITKRDASILPLEPARVNDVMRKFLIAGSGREQKHLLSQLGKMFSSLKEILMCDKVIIVPNSSFLQIPIHMFRLDGKYLFEHTKVSYLPSLKLAAAADDHKKVNKSPKLCIFYTTEERLSVKEAEEIKKIIPKAVLIPDPSEDDLIKYSSRANMVHVIAHHRNGKLHFRNHSYEDEEFLSSLKGRESLVVMQVCGSRVRNPAGPPISHESIAHYFLDKGHNSVIAHNWELAQEASIKFSQTFYPILYSKGSVLDAFSFSLRQLNDLEPIKYGGYMLWGNDFLKFTDRLRADRKVI